MPESRAIRLNVACKLQEGEVRLLASRIWSVSGVSAALISSSVSSGFTVSVCVATALLLEVRAPAEKGAIAQGANSDPTSQGSIGG